MQTSEHKALTRQPGRRATWIGRSGRSFSLAGEVFTSFGMETGGLYLVAKGSNVLWVGSTDDLVADPVSRTRFRLALSCGDRAFRVDGVDLAGDRLATIWDLEGAAPQGALHVLTPQKAA
ncbi:MAG: hypothetical protein KIT02_10775 [Devosia sp.]|uniref:hypothetical protein n=1 Tax=Devosia sp. TaxID=1871048 RepID=UPI0024CC4C20|nr:hypothetical protein [Devosia sp.]UYN98442.1 MAG: hypothetical protein KIT02_10775 [Devosia sp.]